MRTTMNEKTEKPAVTSLSNYEEAMDGTVSRRKESLVGAQILEHSHDADEAMKAFADSQGENLVLDEAANKRILRRIDMIMLPVSFLGRRLRRFGEVCADASLIGHVYCLWVSSDHEDTSRPLC